MDLESVLFLAISALLVLGGVCFIVVFIIRTWAIWKVGLDALVILILVSLLFVIILIPLVAGAFLVYDDSASLLLSSDAMLLILFVLGELVLFAIALLSWRIARHRYNAIQRGFPVYVAKYSTDEKVWFMGLILMNVSAFFTHSPLAWSQWVGWPMFAAGILIMIAAWIWKRRQRQNTSAQK
jgi:hypothetical protein